ncbi:MAG: hypothetical protein ACSHYA_18535 [Opitutaceae bacterium]
MSDTPIDTIRIGRIKATIWENEHEGKTYYNTTVTRSFKVGEEWRENNNFSTEDLPLLRLATDKAFERIYELTAERIVENKSHAEKVKEDQSKRSGHER